MAKTYSRSEITPDLLNQNLQYFFGRPAREYKRGIDEIVLSYPPNEERWLRICDYWHRFCNNPPVVDSKLRTVVEKIAATATTSNMNSILDIFDEFTGFMHTTLLNIKEKNAEKLSSEISEMNQAIYDKSAQIERDAELERQKAKVKADAEAHEALMETKSMEQKVIQDLQEQIADLGKMIDDLSTKSTDGNKLHKDYAYTEEAKRRVSEAKDNANRIADLMQNEIKLKREAEQLRKQEELVRRNDEKDEFNSLWKQYVGKYTVAKKKPTVDLFKKFLIDIKGLTPDQIDAMTVIAKIFDDGIDNFIEFDEEIQRVKSQK